MQAKLLRNKAEQLLENWQRDAHWLVKEYSERGFPPPAQLMVALGLSGGGQPPPLLELTGGGGTGGLHSEETSDTARIAAMRQLLGDVYDARQELASRPLFEGDAPELRLSVREFVVDVAVVRQASAQAPRVR